MLRLMPQINMEKKLITQIPVDDLIGACAYLLEEFESDFNAKPEDFDQDEQIKLLHIKNRKKYLDLLKSETSKEKINQAAQAPLGMGGLHDFFAGSLALVSGMQHLQEAPLHELSVCGFWSKNLSEDDQEKFVAKVKEVTEKLNKTR